MFTKANSHLKYKLYFILKYIIKMFIDKNTYNETLFDLFNSFSR